MSRPFAIPHRIWSPLVHRGGPKSGFGCSSAFWDEAMFDHWGKVDGEVACAFSSSGGWGSGPEIACQSLYMARMNFGFLVFG